MNDKIVMRIYRLYIRKIVKDAFDKTLAARGKKQQESTEKKFFESLVRIHRAGEGAPFTGLKPYRRRNLSGTDH